MNATSQLTLQSRQRERPPRPRATWRRLPTLASFSFNTQSLCKCTCRESWRLPYAISLSLRFTFCEQIIGRSRPMLVLTFRRPSFMGAYAKLTSWVQNLNTRVLNLLNIVFSKASSSLFAGLFFLSAYKTYELGINSLTLVHVKNFQKMSIKPFLSKLTKWPVLEFCWPVFVVAFNKLTS